MAFGEVRWSQLVRKPGTVLVQHWANVEVPPEGGATEASPARPGLRLYVHPVSTAEHVTSIDITSTAAQAMLEGFLRSGIAAGKYLSWQSAGFGPRRRDTVILKGHS
jgi:hypothetical protein